MYSMSEKQVEQAVRAGLEILSEESDLTIPVRLLDGCSLLKILLSGIITGNIVLSSKPVVHESVDKDDERWCRARSNHQCNNPYYQYEEN